MRSSNAPLTRSTALSTLLAALCVLAAGCSGTDSTKTGARCAESNLVAQCPPGTTPELTASATSQCGGSAEADLVMNSGAVTGSCQGTGECRVLCNFATPCFCGVDRITDEGVFCVQPCDRNSACGNGDCEAGENPSNCQIDCGARCEAGASRCNGNDREVCTQNGAFETLRCADGTMCAESAEEAAQCVPDGRIQDMDPGMGPMDMGLADSATPRPDANPEPMDGGPAPDGTPEPQDTGAPDSAPDMSVAAPDMAMPIPDMAPMTPDMAPPNPADCALACPRAAGCVISEGLCDNVHIDALAMACFTLCPNDGGARAGRVLAAADCAEAAQEGGFWFRFAGCEERPIEVHRCVDACARVAECATNGDVCPNLGHDNRDQIGIQCNQHCNNPEVEGFAQAIGEAADCQEVVDLATPAVVTIRFGCD